MIEFLFFFFYKSTNDPPYKFYIKVLYFCELKKKNILYKFYIKVLNFCELEKKKKSSFYNKSIIKLIEIFFFFLVNKNPIKLFDF